MKYTLTALIICLFCMSNTFGKAIHHHGQDTTLYIHLKLKTYSTCTITAAPLKYNKHLAFSFTLDDGYRSAYTCAYPLLNGGIVSPPIADEYHSDSGGDGKSSTGMFYTDGCGNNIPFRLAVALNAGIVYSSPDNRARLSWQEVEQLYQSGWDILNHGYHHLTKHGTNFNTEVLENIQAVKERTGFTMTQFVVPGGEHDPGYEHEYEKDAFAAGAFSVASYLGTGPAIPVEKSLNLRGMIYARDLLSSHKDSVDLPAVHRQVLKMDSLMRQTQPVWYNAFTHNVGNGNLWSISLIYPEFKYLMTSLYEKYGEKGNDKLWMAPWQEVYEYIWLRDHTKIEVQQKGKDVTVRLQISDLPSSFRHKALSLNVQSKSAFSVEEHSANLKVSANGNARHNLLNITVQ